MTSVKMIQIQHESDTWKRLLAFMMSENVHLKERLANVLKNDFDKSLLETLEFFQTSFVEEDDRIEKLRKSISILDQLLQREFVEDGKVIPALEKQVRVTRKAISTEESKFSQIKSSFHDYLLENI
jgi:hypothetical protein